MATNNGIVVPPLQIPPRTNENVPPQPIPNRYDTTICVEYCVNDEVRHIKWFSDIQMAWIWIISRIHNYHNQTQDEEWRHLTFLACADRLDRRWRDGNQDGMLMANHITNNYAYYVSYEPTVRYEDVRDHEEYF